MYNGRVEWILLLRSKTQGRIKGLGPINNICSDQLKGNEAPFLLCCLAELRFPLFWHPKYLDKTHIVVRI